MSKLITGVSFAVCMAATAPMLTGCESTTSNSTTTSRSQLMLTSSAEVMAQADQAYAQVIAEAKAQGKLNTDAKLTKRVQNIADRLIKKAPLFREDCKQWKWEVNVIDSDELNAWCMAGGKIAVYSGLVKTLNLTDDELATVMGHEIAHALREHVREQQSTQMIQDGIINVASTFLNLDSNTQTISKIVANVGVTLPFSRSHETEADALGLELMYDAGYDPTKASGLWKKMMAQGNSNDGLAVLLSTHPGNTDRMEKLDQLAKQLQTQPRRQQTVKLLELTFNLYLELP